MKVKTSDAMIAVSIRKVVRRAYSGKTDGSSEIADCCRTQGCQRLAPAMEDEHECAEH